ncbi:UMP kinase [Listeria sp. FSL L7-1582]|uniref:UMP kinase n=1 Tax=Listeria portnoyi TaxID=2713504 RepID=UPI00164E47D6|nr:UMP kinase [Listeria portnoyi]MBC6310933.1 UMP kinase [Listeria portnoyi]
MVNKKRILIKISGAALGEHEDHFNRGNFKQVAQRIIDLADSGVQVSIVVGGGNLFRGNLANDWGIERAEADNIGTLGTIINSLILRGVLNSLTDREVRVMTSIPIHTVAEPYIRLRAIQHLSKGCIVIFAGGNGQPFVTTDYPAVQRAIETNTDSIVVAKNGVDGVYTADPNLVENSQKYKILNYDDILKNNIRVMDQSALLLAKEHDLPIRVIDFNTPNLVNLFSSEVSLGTIITSANSKLDS